MGKNIGIICCLFFGLNLYAQDSEMSYKQVDSTSYALFLKQDWKALIEFGKASKKEGIDFYYLNVRMGIAYFKDGKMRVSIKYLEEAYKLNAFDVVVQDYLYWAYRYSGMYLESDMFYKKMDKELAATIANKLQLVSAIDVGVVATNNVDYDKMLTLSDEVNSSSFRSFPEKYQLYMLGLNHRFSRNTNFYHRVTVMPTSLVLQKNNNGVQSNSSFEGAETRYYADATFGLGKRWNLDAYLGFFFGDFDQVDITNENPIDQNLSSKYTDVIFGTSISKASYYLKHCLNISYGNLGEFKQFQTGYTLSLFPLGNNLLVPFGSIQYQKETSSISDETHLVYTGGISINTKKATFTAYLNTGEIHNFISNNGGVVYNQSAIGKNEYGAILQFYMNNATFKVGYSYMNMEDYYFTLEEVLTTYKFNQQNIIAGFTWNL